MARENIESPMPGKITQVIVKVGDVVKEDDDIMTLEAMKMENPIVATISGTIVELNVKAGDKVEGGKVLAVIEN